MSNTDGTEVEDKCGALKSVAELLLVDGDGVDQNIAHRRADLVPFRAVVAESSQDDWFAFRQFHVIVIGMFSADGDGVRRDFGCWVKAGRNRVGDNFCALR